MQVVMPVVNSTPKPVVVGGGSVKDSRWLTLEVCREFARNKCTRLDNECRFAHPPSNVEVQNGRVMCCFDSIKGRCQRTDPPCKYLHPPQHLKEQLLQNGRNNLIWRNFHVQNLSGSLPHFVPTMFPLMAQPPPYLIPASAAPSSNLADFYSSPISSATLTSPLSDSLPASVSTIPMLGSGTQQSSSVQTTFELPEGDSSGNGVSSSCSSSAISSCVGNCGSQSAYWMNPSMMDSSLSSATYFSTVFYQGMNAISGVVPVMKSQLIPDVRNGGGVPMYQCGAPSYQQVALSSVPVHQQQQCYQLTVPLTAATMHRY